MPKSSSQRSSGCLQSPNLIYKVCLMGRDVCHNWIRLNILPHNSFPAVQTQSENCTTMRRKPSYSYTNKQTLMPVGSLSSLPSSLMQTKISSKRHQGWRVLSSFEENNKHNKENQSGNDPAQPLTSGIFIVSGEQLIPIARSYFLHFSDWAVTAPN